MQELFVSADWNRAYSNAHKKFMRIIVQNVCKLKNAINGQTIASNEKTQALQHIYI